MDFFFKINWIDICVILILGRVMYSGVKSGGIVEFFKVLGTFVAIFIVFHYYSVLADIVKSSIAFDPGFVDIFFFLFLWLAVFVLFKLLRDVMELVYKVEAHPLVSRWAGGLFAVIRGLWVASLFLVALQVSQIESVKEPGKKALSAEWLYYLAPNVYKSTFDSFVVQFFPQEKFNSAGFDVDKPVPKKK